MPPVPIPTKQQCLAVTLPTETRGKHAAIIARVFAWPDRIPYTLNRETGQQDAALVEFPGECAVVWLREACYGEADDDARREAAGRIFREWARL